jgi:hypothetical protein
MQRKSPLDPVHKDKQIVKVEEEAERTNIRIGAYYSKLKTNQKKRFENIVRAISRRLKLFARKNPVEYILIRQIALNTIRIEEAELSLMDGINEKYASDVEKWLLLAQKERRDAMTTLFTIMKREDKKSGIEKFNELRDILREEKDLPPSKVQLTPDGHDRRHYDDITRTTT